MVGMFRSYYATIAGVESSRRIQWDQIAPAAVRQADPCGGRLWPTVGRHLQRHIFSGSLRRGDARFRDDQPRTASLNAFAGRSRTTVFALILIASPVCGFRPMRALRCAFTARPRLGITNFPALPLHSFTASLKSSSKKLFTVFLGVSHLSARKPTTFDLLIGFAISIFFPPLAFQMIRAFCGGPNLGRARATL